MTRLTDLAQRLYARWRGPQAAAHSPRVLRRGPMVLVVILDGTMSSLQPGCETNAGLTCKLLRETGPGVAHFYEAGIQWQDWSHLGDVMQGRGLNRQIRRAYGWLASRYRPGDRIFLFGYSRGAYAVRSLAGVIDHVGLLRSDHATERHIQTAYRHYQSGHSPVAQVFAARHCHDGVAVEGIFAWDTVKSLGWQVPLLRRSSAAAHAFHDHHLSRSVKAGFHALALDETRLIYAPVLWECPPDWSGRIEQVWFRGSHGDVGGQLGGFAPARGLSNIPLVWMLDRAESCGLALPAGWRTRFPGDPAAPAVGTWAGPGKLFLRRARRVVGRDRSEQLHDSVPQPAPARGGWWPSWIPRTPRTPSP